MNKEKGEKIWTWTCPYDRCLSRGMKAATWYVARDYGRSHITDHHKEQEKLKPIVVKAETVFKNNGGAAKRYTWKCPVKKCGGCGWKPMKKSKALRYGRDHMKLIHDSMDMEPIVVECKRKQKRKVNVAKKRKQKEE